MEAGQCQATTNDCNFAFGKKPQTLFGHTVLYTEKHWQQCAAKPCLYSKGAVGQKSLGTSALKTRLKRLLVSQAFYNAGEFLAFDWETAQLED
ncbi:hypothetical protein J6590_086021 [Homalodisca vitripennis]|nr:hypothetical protein J6590_086021 [Homalodisca vitripennis]